MRVAASIRAALELAEDDRAVGRTLTTPAAKPGEDSDEFAAMIERFTMLMMWGTPKTHRSKRAARASVLVVARQMLLQMETKPEASVAEIAPDLIVFVLTPYVGLDEARRCAG